MFEEGRGIERGESEGAVWVQGHASTVPASDVDKRSAGETGASLEAEESSKFQQALGTRGSFLRQPESDLRDEQLLPALSQTGPQRPHPPSSLLPRLLATTRASSPPNSQPLGCTRTRPHQRQLSRLGAGYRPSTQRSLFTHAALAAQGGGICQWLVQFVVLPRKPPS